MVLLDGKSLRDEILLNVKNEISNNNMDITLAIIMVGDNEASKIYVRNKRIACENVGINCIIHELDSSINESSLINLINELNDDSKVTGIILQSPIPDNLDFDKCCKMILPSKDVDGFTKDNIYDLYLNNEQLVPCTVKGIIKLLDYYNISLEGKNVTIVGRGNIVGKPLMLALLNRNATVTIAHSKTKNLADATICADIVISAVGKPNLVTADMIKDDAVVIDVGISRVDGKVVGDVSFETVKDKCSYITPVPGGVGPMTVAMIMENLLIAYRKGE